MSFDSQISNFYEKLVVEELTERQDDRHFNDDMLIDIACVALNQLPSRYYRFSVDMAFYLSANEYHEMQEQVREAVSYAIDFVTQHKHRAETG